MDPVLATMLTKAHKALSHAYAPYSRFHVACCIQTSNNKLYTGVNVENGSYSLGVCAETSAISAMISAGEQHIQNIIVLCGTNLLCPPCGACRQRIYEFSTPETLVHLCNNETVLRSMSIKELLPLAFDFKPL